MLGQRCGRTGGAGWCSRTSPGILFHSWRRLLWRQVFFWIWNPFCFWNLCSGQLRVPVRRGTAWRRRCAGTTTYTYIYISSPSPCRPCFACLFIFQAIFHIWNESGERHISGDMSNRWRQQCLWRLNQVLWVKSCCMSTDFPDHYCSCHTSAQFAHMHMGAQIHKQIHSRALSFSLLLSLPASLLLSRFLSFFLFVVLSLDFLDFTSLVFSLLSCISLYLSPFLCVSLFLLVAVSPSLALFPLFLVLSLSLAPSLSLSLSLSLCLFSVYLSPSFSPSLSLSLCLLLSLSRPLFSGPLFRAGAPLCL